MPSSLQHGVPQLGGNFGKKIGGGFWYINKKYKGDLDGLLKQESVTLTHQKSEDYRVPKGERNITSYLIFPFFELKNRRRFAVFLVVTILQRYQNF